MLPHHLRPPSMDELPESDFLSSLLRAHDACVASRRADRSKASKIELSILKDVIKRVARAAKGRLDAFDANENFLRGVAGVVKEYLTMLVRSNQTWRMVSRTEPRMIAYRDMFEGTRRAVLRTMVVYEDMRCTLRRMRRKRMKEAKGDEVVKVAQD